MKTPIRVPGPAHFMIAAAVLAAAGCAPEVETTQEPRPVRTVRVAANDTRALTAFAGEIRARYESDISFRVPGKIVARTADLGATVRRGQVLARLDPQDAQLNVAASRASLASAESDLEFARADLARYKDLLDRKFIAPSVYEQKLNAFKAAEARRDAARAQAGVTGNQAQYTTLTADADGVVTAVLAEPGQVVAAGQPVVRIARLGEKDAVINVAENQLQQLRTAPRARVALWATPDRIYNGRVREIAAAADPATRTYTVKVALEDADEALRWGMSANVAFAATQPEAARAFVLPATALTQSDDKSGNKPSVWVVGADRRVKLVSVTVGRYDEAGVTITGGLAGGETVVTAGVHKLLPGQQVRVLAEERTAGPARAVASTQGPDAAQRSN